MAELLAPVGNISALKAAIYWGADAVYLGLDAFNARIKAENFTFDNIKQYIDLAHLFGVKVYITFNTNVRNNEKATLEKYVEKCVESKADAFIVTDLGTLGIFRRYDVPLHASTQLGVHNLLGAKLLEELGFCRVVVSRETLESDIIDIKNNTNLEIEYFVHGAMCVSFSGGCLMSSFMSCDSGNRGRCNQPCRLRYSTTLNNEKPKYLLSPADQCLISQLDRLAGLGVDSFKIEGRLKSAHYVGQTVHAYRQVMDKKSKINDEIISGLLRAYNRGGFSQGYNYSDTPKIMSVDIQNNMGEYIGDISDYIDGKIVVNSNTTINVGDGLKIVDGDRQYGLTVKKADVKQNKIIIPYDKTLRQGKVYLTFDSMQSKTYGEVNPELKVDMSVRALIGEPLSISAKCGSSTYTVSGGCIEQSQKYTLDYSTLKNMIDRLGGTPFKLSGFDAQFDEKAFLPASLVNDMRRRCLQGLQDEILNKYESNMQKVVFSHADMCERTGIVVDNTRPFVEVSDVNELTDYVLQNTNFVIYPQTIDKNTANIILNNQIFYNNIDKFINNGYIRLPRIARGKDIDIITNFVAEMKSNIKGLICDNLYAVALCDKFGLAKIGGYGLNVYNREAIEELKLDYSIASLELNLGQLKSFDKDKIMIFGYGYPQVMTLTHCPIQLNTGCDGSDCKYNGKFFYKDNVANYMVLRYKTNHCYFALHNPNPLDLRDKFDKIDYQFYICAIERDGQDIDEIVKNYIGKTGYKMANGTAGHLKRGVN
ncbi:MAG: U32 family peptidase [Christensenellales bacterium]